MMFYVGIYIDLKETSKKTHEWKIPKRKILMENTNNP